jgi:hypothetical protein
LCANKADFPDNLVLIQLRLTALVPIINQSINQSNAFYRGINAEHLSQISDFKAENRTNPIDRVGND